jgi:hypothetical protein
MLRGPEIEKPNLVDMMREGWYPVGGLLDEGFELYEQKGRWRVYDHNNDKWYLEFQKGSLKLWCGEYIKLYPSLDSLLKAA